MERSYTPLCFVSLSGVDIRLSVHGCVWVCVGALSQRAELNSAVVIVVQRRGRRHVDEKHRVPPQGRGHQPVRRQGLRGHQHSFVSESGGTLRCASCH
jgi:hypothetical protein